MKFEKATERYEAWLVKRLRLVAEDLDYKHAQMRQGAFPFLRATFYRWAQTWAGVCKAEARAPRVLAAGDLHVENFGTWRDAEGRLVWGINDFDEAWRLPYTGDLVRLATSALLAEMDCDAKTALAAILDGYREALAAGGGPLVLAERHDALRAMAIQRLHEPQKFWDKLTGLEDVRDRPPASALRAIERMLPERGLAYRVKHRVSGLGSLGRERYTAIAQWQGGWIAREAKAVAPSACAWAEGVKGRVANLSQEALDSAVRCRDPFVRVKKRWIVRRLAPDCVRIELADLPAERDEVRLLHAMGWETANLHLGSAKARVLRDDLGRRPRRWLLDAARKMEEAVRADYRSFGGK